LGGETSDPTEMTIWGNALDLSATIHPILGGRRVSGVEEPDRNKCNGCEKSQHFHRRFGGKTDHADLKSLSRATFSNFQNDAAVQD